MTRGRIPVMAMAVALVSCGGGGASDRSTTTIVGPTPPVATVQSFADQGQDHLEPADVEAILAGAPGPDYNSSPATSGPHAEQSAPCGIYLQDVPDVFLVHTMEHGAIVIHYDPDLVFDPSQLQQFVRDRGAYAVVHPRSGLGKRVVVTAWTKLLELDSVDLNAIGRFHDDFAGRGPEAGVPCPVQIDESAPDV